MAPLPPLATPMIAGVDYLRPVDHLRLGRTFNMIRIRIFVTQLRMQHRVKTKLHDKQTSCRLGISNSNCSVGYMRTYKITRGPHYDADATIAVPELTRNSFYILFPAKGIMNYRQIISSRLRNLFTP